MARGLRNVPIFWKSAIALSCCRVNFAHLAKSSCADTALSSRFKRTTSFLSTMAFLWEEDVGVGSLLYIIHNCVSIVSSLFYCCVCCGGILWE
jgi:hypothetical protein